MAIEMHAIVKKGGRELINLLEYSVLTINTDALCTYLIWEYQLRPTADGGLAIFDLFCAANAPARISLMTAPFPPDALLKGQLEKYRQPTQEPPSHEPPTPLADEDSQLASPRLPPKYLFDSLLRKLLDAPAIKQLEQSFNPALTAYENLPDGKLKAGQRAFLENIWLPVVRPALVAAGFWRVATLG